MMIAEYFSRSFCCKDSRSRTPSVISIISIRMERNCTFDNSLITGAVFKTNSVSNFISKLDFHLFTHTFGHTHCRHPPRLSTPNHSSLAISSIQKELRQLSCLPGTGLSDNDDNLIISDNPEKFLPNRECRQELSLLLQSLAS